MKLFSDMPRDQSGRDTLDEFLKEIEAQRQLKHSNILPVIDYGRQAKNEPGPFIVYPMCEGGSLRNLLAKRQFIPLAEALPLLEQLAQAIDYAHSCGFIHGDIKPENVLFPSSGSQLALSDFGMSRHFPRKEALTTCTGGGGSAAYLSPEQLAEGEQSSRSDIYALGLVSFEILTGKLPIKLSAPPFRQMEAKVYDRLTDPLEANPDLPLTAASALRAALRADRKLRPSSALEFCRMLRGECGPSQPTQPNAGFWSSLDTKVKVGLITVVVTAMAGIITAAIKILPELLK
jgi:serine/threonine-protein kinase